jgi:hypothetical protein
MNAFFLDFDGVMHPDTCDENLEFCKLPFIENTLKPFLGEWKIVISSNWKNIQTIDQLKSNFSDEIKEHIIGVTPTIKFTNHPMDTRGKEIELFIKKNNINNFIIIDDINKFLLTNQKKFTVTTDSKQGFTNKSRNTLLKIMKNINK